MIQARISVQSPGTWPSRGFILEVCAHDDRRAFWIPMQSNPTDPERALERQRILEDILKELKA